MKQAIKRALCLLMVAALLAGFAVPVRAADTGSKVTFTQVDNSNVSASLLTRQEEAETSTPDYAETDMIRVSIVLEEKSTIEAGYSTQSIARNTEAMAYRAGLQKRQDTVTAAISRKLGAELDVVWNLTLAANIISANVAYGQIEAIESTPGVAQVLIETRYEPDVVSREETVAPHMATSGKQIGSTLAWNAGYTGAGTRIAVIDTGADVDHQSLDAGAYQYSLARQASLANMTVEAYTESLNLLDAEEIASLAENLNVSVDADTAYINAKIPFGYNYVDGDYDVTHLNDAQGEHGSHVAGISTANAYVPKGDGTYARALDTVYVQGVAPDAQLLVMKVFGKSGGAYDADYMAAIEDAVLLGCDAVNLSLGSGNPGMSRSATEEYQTILESLQNSGTVVTMSAGNSGSWVEYAHNAGYLYAEDVSMQTNGSPGSFTNSLTVASVDNDGLTGAYVTVGDNMIVYNETDFSNAPFATIAGDHEYVFIDAVGAPEDWAKVQEVLEGKIALCYRGTTSFFEKAKAAVDAGAIATFVVNNQPGVINMDLSDYPYTQPVASLNQADGELIKAASTAVTDDAGNVLYYTGTMAVASGVGAGQFNSAFYTMSSFSSWGIPGSLELKPEITAPGGNIYSLFGSIPDGGGVDQYELLSGTSMAAPQVAGMAALVMQYIREEGLEEKTGLDARTLAQSLLMSTAVPLFESAGNYYPVIRQGAGLGNVGAVVTADSYILMDENATASYADGKVKAELGDDPQRTGVYTFDFTIHNMTDVEKNFALSADFFVQASIADDDNTYMDTSTDLIGADVTWAVNGVEMEPAEDLAGLDFNGDSVVNADDGQAILNYATGVAVNLTNQEKADLDADGDVDTYDAYLFLSRLNAGTAMVPANGAAQVTVTAKLSDDSKAAMDYNYPNGTYVQGYVYAESLSDMEGNLGTSHSIPVLGFYGKWSDPSMFDVGSYQTYATGEETRTPYLGNTSSNTYTIAYAKNPDVEYYFGGNPLVADAVYMPERNAINSENGDKITKVSFIAIRNAAASRFTAVNNTTGEILTELFPGAVNSAFYYVNGGYWSNTNYNLNVGFDPDGAPEGTAFELALSLAPEYDVDVNGNVAWEDLGRGTSLTVPMVVDNTAPVLTGVSLDFLNNKLVVRASDNQYVAAVVLTNKAGNRIHACAGSKTDVLPNETAEYVLDLNGVNGEKFMVQVVDYAMNTVTYLLETQIGEPQPLPEFIAFDLDEDRWTTFARTSSVDDLGEYAPSDVRIFAATIVDHIVLAASEDGMLYAMPVEDLTDMVLVGDLNTVISDMAYNPQDGKVYGVDEKSQLVTIDRLTAEVEVVGTLGVVTNTLACDENGTFYCNGYGYQTVYSFTLDTLDTPQLLVEKLDSYSKYVQSMEINPNDGKLYYTSFYSLTSSNSWFYEIDTKTGEFVKHTNLIHELSALIIPSRTGTTTEWSDPTDQVTGIQFAPTSVTLLRGGKTTLSALVQPWTATDRTVTWSTSDPSVADVNTKGVVTAVDVGTATITATSNLDPTVSATCVVTVEKLDATIKGALQAADGNTMFFNWNAAVDTTWTAGAAIDTNLASATRDTINNKVYISDTDAQSWALHVVDPATGKSEQVLPNGMMVPLTDLAYSTYYSTADTPRIHTIFYTVFVPGQNIAAMDGNGVDMSAYMAVYSGGTQLVAVASMGYESYYYADYGMSFDTEHVVMLDDAGYIWHFYVMPDGAGGYTGIIEYTPTNLDIRFPGDSTGYLKYTSMVAGDDGNLYLSAFTGKTNELFRLSYDANKAMYTADKIGDVGQDVWPAVLTDVTSNQTIAGADQLPHEPVAMVSTRFFASEALYGIAGNGAEVTSMTSTHAAAALPASDSEVAPTEDTVTVTITTDEAATNGLTIASYDTSKLALESVVVNGDYTAKLEEDGKLTFGYVSLTEIPAEGTIATLTFKVLEAVESTVTVEHKQVNNTAGSTETLSVEFEHPNTEIRDAVEATCTTAGYTGDTWCLDCGQLVKKGEVIEAKGHSYGQWTVTKAATCTEKGEEIRTCEVCGETETREIPPYCPAEAYTDVNTKMWYHEGVCYVIRKGLMEGKDVGIFAPEVNLSRAELVTVLYRMAGEPSVEGKTHPFEDVSADAWYAEAVTWAFNEEVVKGMSTTAFAPDRDISREQIALILFRYSHAEKVEENALEAYTDASSVSNYAVDAMNWAVATGLIKGTTDTTLAPRATAIRAQAATILMRYCEK